MELISADCQFLLPTQLTHHDILCSFLCVGFMDGIFEDILLYVSVYRQDVSTCPTPLYVATQVQSWTLSSVLIMTTSLLVALRTAVSW